MKNTLVIGSGITGLTSALLLAKKGRQVTLVEKLPHIGGLLNRFTRKGCRFDTGLHFTGGFDNILAQMLQYLNLQDDVKPAPIRSKALFADDNTSIELPTTGLDALENTYSSIFPDYARQIHQYYEAEKNVIANTPIFDLEKLDRISVFSQFTDFDHCTTDEFMDSIALDSPKLRALLPILSLCHGTPPCEAPFSYHCRCAFGMDSHLTAVEHGGDSFINGFKRELAKYGATICTSTWIERLVCNETTPECHTAILNTGEALDVDEIYFTINPNAYIDLFPEAFIHPRLRKRVKRLLPTCSFITIYGTIDKEINAQNSLTFYLKGHNLNEILLPGHNSSSTGIVISNDPMNQTSTFTAFHTRFLEDFLQQVQLDPNIPYNRQPSYLEYKEECKQLLETEVLHAHPEFKGHLHIIDAGTPLTCQRFSPPTGSAYGTRQPLATSRLLGKLPIQNCYALGHHTYFPGILGSMLGAFIFIK